jgi:hypothetical protein
MLFFLLPTNSGLVPEGHQEVFRHGAGSEGHLGLGMVSLIACYFVCGYRKTRKMTVSNSHQVVVSIEKIC